MKILSVVGARPQFIKAAMVSRALKTHGQEILVHTGQHYDNNMSQIFFDELGLAEPELYLNVGSGSHAEQTGRMMVGIEKILIDEKPDCTLIYGDTNSTLAGALSAAKLNIPVAHVEAGLRSFNRTMPEEINRVICDHISEFLFSPGETAVNNLSAEGITSGVYLVGDVMADAVYNFIDLARQKSNILKTLGLKSREYGLLTIHHAGNTDEVGRLSSIFSALAAIPLPVLDGLRSPSWKKWLVHRISDPIKGLRGEIMSGDRKYLVQLVAADRAIDVARVLIWLFWPGPAWLAERYGLKNGLQSWLACFWHPLIILSRGLRGLFQVLANPGRSGTRKLYD